MGTDPLLEGRLDDLIDIINASQLSEQEILQQLQMIENTDTDRYKIFMNQLETLSQERKGNMKEIYDLTRSLETSAEYNSQQYEQQVQLLILTDEKLNDIKEQIQSVQDEKVNKQSQVKVSSYYHKYYRAWSGYMAISFFIVVLNIVFLYLARNEYIPAVIIPFVVALSLITLIMLAVDIRRRDNIIFDEYDWNFNSNTVKLDQYVSSSNPISSNPTPAASDELTKTCAATVAASIEESGGTIQCEEGKIYDTALFKCVVTPGETEGNVEGFQVPIECKTVNIE
jgi:hypothetical protein